RPSLSVLRLLCLHVEDAHHRHRRLLRVRREWPRCRAAEQHDEVAAPHSITSSASASKLGGTIRPSALAVLRLIASSNWSTDRPACERAFRLSGRGPDGCCQLIPIGDVSRGSDAPAI